MRINGFFNWYWSFFGCWNYQSWSKYSYKFQFKFFNLSKSHFLQEATSLPHRPVLHCTSLFTVVALLLALLSIRIHSICLLKMSVIIVTATWTHHWRDGYRHGIWICPIGSTPPYSYFVYLIGLIVLPIGLQFGLKFITDIVTKSNVKHVAPIFLI
jgi:hypothetical protein